jgi:hypothetical protein
MNASTLLDDLRSRDVLLEADGERLVVDAPAGVVTEDLRASLAEHKPSLLKILEWERSKLEEADRRGFVAKWSRELGWISLHDPLTGEWHDWPAADCLPSIVAEANRRRRKGGAA